MAELDPSVYGLDYSTSTGNQTTVADLIQSLETSYCGPITAEFMHLEVVFFLNFFAHLLRNLENIAFQSWQERQWFGETFERIISSELKGGEKLRLAELMLKCQVGEFVVIN